MWLFADEKTRKLRRIKKSAEYPVALGRRILKRKRKKLTDNERTHLESALKALDEALQRKDVEGAKKALENLNKVLREDLHRFYKSPARDTVEWLAAALIIALLLRFFVIEAFKIPSGSMYPTLWVGDHIFVNKFIYGLEVPVVGGRLVSWGKPERGDVIVFRYPLNPHEDYIKRVIGLPGDTVEVRGRRVFINGKEVPCGNKQPYRYKDRYGTIHNTTEYTCTLGDNKFNVIYEYTPEEGYSGSRKFVVPEGHYFVMGDNRDHSADSRVWGFVPEENIKGKAIIVWLCWSKVHGFVVSRIGTVIH